MTTFPSIAPIYPASKGSAPNLSSVQLGDGYKTRYSFGLNNTKPEWKLEWLVDQNSADAIDLFLQSCADNSEFFQWQPPDSNSELNWRCDEWSIEQQSYNLYSIKATFKQIFELAIIQLASVSTTCPQDSLCENDYVDIGTDFWVSKMVSPYANVGYKYAAGWVGYVVGAQLVTDSVGNSYCVMATEEVGVQYLAITKRKSSGEVVWTKKHYLPGGGGQFTLSIQGAVILDIGNGREVIGVFFPQYFGLQFDSFGVYDTSDGSFRFGLRIGGSMPIQGHTLGIGCAKYSKCIVILRNEFNNLAFDVLSATNGSYKGGSVVIPQGTTWPSNIDTPESANFIEFSDGNCLVFFNQYAYRLLVVALDDTYSPRFLQSDRYYNCGAGCTSVEFGNGCLVATSARIYYFDRSGFLLREIIHSEGYPLSISVDENGIYMVTTGPSVSSTMRTVKISLDFSVISTRNHCSASNNNFTGDWSNFNLASWGAYANSNFYTPTNRVVACYNAGSTNAYQPSPANYPVFQVFGGRMSSVGSYTTMSIGEYTASAAGYLLNTPLTSYSTPTGWEPIDCTYDDRTAYFTEGLYVIQGWTAVMVDASNEYLWNFYSINFSG